MTERELFESHMPALDVSRNANDGYNSGITSVMWESWQVCASRIPVKRDLKDPRVAEDEPRKCATNRFFFRLGVNAAIDAANKTE